MLNFATASSIFARKGYEFFDGNKPYNLNIIGVRTSLSADNKFDDLFQILYRDEQLRECSLFTTCTTKPGLYYLQNLMNPHGTGILPEGQYKGCWQIGLHKGEYEALVQCKPLPVYRDNNKDLVYDLHPNTIEKGMWGLDIHHANPNAVSQIVDKWSAACQVLNDPQADAQKMALCHKAEALYGNSFTYTLLNSKDLA